MLSSKMRHKIWTTSWKIDPDQGLQKQLNAAATYKWEINYLNSHLLPVVMTTGTVCKTKCNSLLFFIMSTAPWYEHENETTQFYQKAMCQCIWGDIKNTMDVIWTIFLGLVLLWLHPPVWFPSILTSHTPTFSPSNRWACGAAQCRWFYPDLD